MELSNFITGLEKVLVERNSEGENFFHEVARCGSFSFIARFMPFIRKSCTAAALNTPNSAGQMGIHIVAETHGKWYAAKLIDILVELGADINGQESVEGNTVLHLAVNHRDYELAEWLCCQPGIDLGRRNAKNLSPLELAQKNKNRKMIQILRK
ncbi:hypothetical protein G9C98_000841 [Cotesia typhae]|nr:hypothetical protein G9C98_000841 [Cotesia typhae]